MTYDDIIAEIKSNLTGNADKDKAYLIKQFKMHNLKEIHMELGRLLWDLMSDEEQKEYKKAVIQDIPVDEFIKSVYSYLNYGDFETALKELEDYMEIIPFKFRENPQFDYFYFNNPLEEELFRKYFKTPKELKVIPFGEEYPRVFYLYGVVLMNLSEFNRAERALKKALSYNPVSGEILSTLAALYDRNYDLDNLKKTSVEILKFSYDPRDGEKVSSPQTDKNMCPKCGIANDKNTNFCRNCGHKIENGASISEKQREWNARRDEIIERYDKLAEEFGIKNEDYFLTSVKRYNFLEPGTTKHKKINAVLGYNPGLYLGNETIIDGFFLIKEDKFVFMEIDNRDFKKVNAGINNFYFDKIVSMRVTKSLGDESKYEDITKRAWTSPHDIKRSIQNDIQSLKAIRFKDLIINNDSADMFDRLLIKLVDNTSYEIRLPSYDFGQKLVDLFESLKGQPQKVIIENQNSQPNKAQLLSEYQELLNSGAITQEEYDKLKQETLFN